MLVSIIIPIYNVENYIEECLESVFQQTYPHIEVILVNDCTPDNAMKIANSIINKYKDKFPTTIVNHEQNKGLSEARNSGMKIAKGEYIYFIDSDDAIMHDTIESLIQVAIIHKGVELIRGEFTRDTNYRPQGKTVPPIIKLYEGTESKIRYYNNAYSWNILYKRTFIEDNNLVFIASLLYEDVAFQCTLITSLTYFAELQKVTYYYRIVKNSLSLSTSHKHIESILYILQLITENIISLNDTLQKLTTKHYTKFSLIYWSYSWRIQPYHQNYFQTYKSVIKKFLKKHLKELDLINLLFLSPALFPYNIAKYYIKIIWTIQKFIQ